LGLIFVKWVVSLILGWSRPVLFNFTPYLVGPGHPFDILFSTHNYPVHALI